MFITQAYKTKLIESIGRNKKYMRFGPLSIVFDKKAEFDKLYNSIESKVIDEYLSASDTSVDGTTVISTDLEFQHAFRKNNTLRAYLTKDSARFSVNFGLTRHRTQIVKHVIESLSGDGLNFLEVGAGSSVGTATASKCSNVSHAIALDYDAFSLAKIVPVVFDNLGVDKSKVSTHVGTFSDTGQSEASVDVIYAGGALHHCVDFHDAFNEAFRILKPGGVFLISDFVPHNYLSKRGRDFIFDSPHGPDEYIKKERGEPFFSNADVKEHFRSEVELLYHAQMSGFQTKSYKFARPSNNFWEVARNFFAALFRKRQVARIVDFDFDRCGYDSAGNHIEIGAAYVLSPAIFNYLAIAPYFVYRRLGVLAPRFDNRLYILRKPKSNETVSFVDRHGNKLNDIPV
jgi:ubiquinone/menaquinone biosynthesis C-methylase UbiE